MSDLAKINRDEWADKPYLIELRGGRSDGQRFHWHELPMVWRVPEPALPFLSDATMATAADLMPVADYRDSGSVTDDGAHIYEYSEHE